MSRVSGFVNRRRLLVAWIVLAALGAGAGWAGLQTPRFDSTALVGLAPGTATGDVTEFVDRQVERGRQPATLEAVQARAETAPGVDDDVTVTVQRLGVAIAIRSRTTDPATAQAIAALYAAMIIDEQPADEDPRLVMLAPPTSRVDPATPDVVQIAVLSGLAGLAVAAVSVPVCERRRTRRSRERAGTPAIEQLVSTEVEALGPGGPVRVPRVPADRITARQAARPKRPRRSPVVSGPAA